MMIADDTKADFDDPTAPDEGPEGWEKIVLRDGVVLNVQPGFACGANNRDGQGLAHLRPMNVNVDGQIDLTNLKYIPESEGDRDQRLVKQGDVVFNNTNSPELVGKTAFYDLPEPRSFSNHMTRLRCHPKALDPRFCAMTLHQKWREGYFQTVCNNHISQSSVSRAALLETPILLPPLPEQKRIVAKVEELLARVNATKERLAKVSVILKRFRQAILAAACSGQLTAEWADNQKRLTPVEQSIRDILQVRQKFSRKEDDFIKNYAPPKDNDFPPLPKGWTVVSSDVLFSFVTSGSRGWAKYYTDSGPIFIRIGNLDHNSIHLNISDIQHVTPPSGAERNRTRVQPGDILISITADVGMTALVPDEFGEAYVNQHVAIARPIQGVYKPYLAWYLSSSGGQAQFQDLQRGATKIGLGLDDIKSLVIPFPPLEEQQEIVRRVEALLRVADSIEKRVKMARSRAGNLAQAILSKAFRGELLPTEAEMARREGRSYEPASALLARIKAMDQGLGNA